MEKNLKLICTYFSISAVQDLPTIPDGPPPVVTRAHNSTYYTGVITPVAHSAIVGAHLVDMKAASCRSAFFVNLHCHMGWEPFIFFVGMVRNRVFYFLSMIMNLGKTKIRLHHPKLRPCFFSSFPYRISLPVYLFLNLPPIDIRHNWRGVSSQQIAWSMPLLEEAVGEIRIRFAQKAGKTKIGHFKVGCADRDEQMSKGWPFSLLNDEQMSNWVGVEHQPAKWGSIWFNCKEVKDTLQDTHIFIHIPLWEKETHRLESVGWDMLGFHEGDVSRKTTC